MRVDHDSLRPEALVRVARLVLVAVLGVLLMFVQGPPALADDPSAESMPSGSASADGGALSADPSPETPEPASGEGVDDSVRDPEWVEPTGAGVVRPDWVSAAVTARAKNVRVEVLSERTESARTWVLPDGSATSEAALAGVRFEDPKAKDSADGWVDIDPTLVQDSSGTVTAKAVPGEVVLAGEGDPGLVSLTSPVGGAKVSVGTGLDAALPEPVLDGSGATYAEVLEGVDLRVDVRPHGVEVHWVLKSGAGVEAFLGVDGVGPVSKDLTVPVSLAKGVKAKLGKHGSVEFADAKGRSAGSVSGSAAMWDGEVDPTTGEPAEVEALPVTASSAGKELTTSSAATGSVSVQLGLDRAWLTDPGRQFPITVDPTYASGTAGGGFDTFVEQGFTGDMSGDEHLKLGNNGSGQVARSYLTFDASKVTGKKIMSAQVKLYEWHSWSCSSRDWAVYDSAVPSSSTRWTAQPSIGSKRATSSDTKGFSSSCPNGWVAADMKAQMQAFADGSGGNKGVMLRAVDESDPYGWKQFDSREGSNPPVFSWTYNRVPASMAAPTVTGAVSYQAAGDASPVLYTADTTPNVSGVVSDPDGNTVQGKFYLDGAPASGGLASCLSGSVASGSRAVCDLDPALVADSRGYLRARAKDSNGEYGGFGPVLEVRVAAVAPAAPVVSCPAPYANNTWQAGGPAANLTCTISAVGTGYSSPSKIRWSVDNASFTDTSIPQSGSAGTAKATVTVPKAAGGHTVRAYALSPSGKISSMATYTLGWGTPSLIAPAASPVATTTDRVAVEASGPPKGTSAAPSAKVQWRVAGAASATAGWLDAPSAALSVTEASGASKAVGVFDTTTVVGQADGSGITVPARVATRLEVRVCLAYTGGVQCTSGSPVVRVPHAFGSGFPEADAGPGRVALWTGELSISDTDAELATPDGGLSISRAHTSFAGPAAPQNAVFGPGWVAAFDGDEAGMSGSELIDSTHVDGSLVISDPEGEDLIFLTPTGARRTAAGLPTGDYRPADEETEAAGIRLVVSGSGTSTTIKLITDDGTITTFKPAAAPATNVATVFRASEVADVAVASKTTYTYDGAGRVTAIVAGLPDGVSACAPGVAAKGCRVLKIGYASATTATATVAGDVAGQVTSITAQVNTDPDRQLASYLYDGAGRLVKVTDTRTGLATSYGWVGTGPQLRLTGLTPPGLAPFTYAYAGNKLERVTRPNPVTAGGGTAQLAAFVYGVPVAGIVTDLPDLGAEAAAWQLASPPTGGFAVFGQDAPITGAPAAGDPVWKSADLQFTDPLGYTVATGSYGAGDWQLTAAEYDDNDNVVRSWDERAIAALRAGEVSDPEAVSTRTVYNADIKNAAGDVVTPAGSLVTEVYTPAHAVIAGGELKVLRTHTVTTYDQGAPNGGVNPDTGQPYRLATKNVVRSEDASGNVEDTLSTSFTGYEPLVAGDRSGWALGTATSTTTDMDGDGAVSAGDITTRTRFDDRGRVIEQRQPKSDGTDAGTRQTVYYTGATSSVAACGGKPEYAGMVCRVGLKAQPAGTSLPVTWTWAYTWDLDAAVSAEVSGAAESVSTTSFDPKDRAIRVGVVTTGVAGSAAVPDVTTGYDDATGLATGSTSSAGATATSYDAWGREVSLRTTAGGGVDDTSTSTYDAAGRVIRVVDNNGETRYSFDGTDANGKSERRGLVTGIAVKVTGGVEYTSAAGYDADGALAIERLPGQVVKRTVSDITGEPTGLTYSGWAVDPATGTIEADQPWLGWSTASNASGQITREWMPNGGNEALGVVAISSDRSYGYDRGGRLTRVNDITGNPSADQPIVACQVRTYGFDANGNRTTQASYDAGADGNCQTSTATTTTSRSFDVADRPTTGGNGAGSYTYDLLGRQTVVPAADAPNPSEGDIALGYYDTDAVKQITQDGITTAFTLDGSGRRLTQTVSSGGTQQSQLVRHYTDGSDNPTWSVDTASAGATTTRYAELASGDLGLTLTTKPDGATTGELALTAPRSDIAATISIGNGSQTFAGAALAGIDTWSDYTEYGSPRQSANRRFGGVVGIGYGWFGSEEHTTTESGLTLLGARLYNASTAMFASIDPIFGGNVGAYAYPRDPINTSDTSGMWCKAQIGTTCTRFLKNENGATVPVRYNIKRRISIKHRIAWGTAKWLMPRLKYARSEGQDLIYERTIYGYLYNRWGFNCKKTGASVVVRAIVNFNRGNDRKTIGLKSMYCLGSRLCPAWINGRKMS